MLVGADSSQQTVFHCDLHCFQKNSQPERQPPTYSLTSTSHLHFVIPLLPLIFRATEGYHLRTPSEIPREDMKVIILQHTIQGLQENILQPEIFSPVHRTAQNKQTNRNTHTHSQKKKKKDKMSEVFQSKTVLSHHAVLSYSCLKSSLV